MIASNFLSDRNELAINEFKWVEFGHIKANWTLFCIFGMLEIRNPLFRKSTFSSLPARYIDVCDES